MKKISIVIFTTACLLNSAHSQTPQLVKDIYSGSSSSQPMKLFPFNGKMYFTSRDASSSGNELSISDGTAGGTQIIININSIFGSTADFFTPYNGELYFTANDNLNGYEIWKTDGTVAGTNMFMDLNPGIANGVVSHLIEYSPFMEYNGLLYFMGDDGVHGLELWRTDGTVSGTQMFYEINPAPGYLGSSGPGEFAIYNNKLFFWAYDGVVTPTVGADLWCTDGTVVGTFKMKELNGTGAVAVPIWPSKLVELNGKLYFASSDSINSNGKEFWETDGTSAGTQMVIDINPGTSSSYPFDLVKCNGKLFFRATTATTGYELWTSDGTAAGTQLTKDINPATSGNAMLGSFYSFNNLLYFYANDSNLSNYHLWTSDGTTAGTQKLIHAASPFIVQPWSNGFGKPAFFSFGTTLFFRSAQTNGFQLWSLDGTTFTEHLYAGGFPNPVADNSITEFSMNIVASELFFPGKYVASQGAELFKISLSTAISEIIRDNWCLLPNPCNGIFSIDVKNNFGPGSEAEIFNVMGNKIYHTHLKAGVNTIDLSRETAGVYLVKVYEEEKMYVKKLVIE